VRARRHAATGTLGAQRDLGVQDTHGGERAEHREGVSGELRNTAVQRVDDEQHDREQFDDEHRAEQAGGQRPYRPPSDPERAKR
jgi:hypothetical protein